MAAAVINNSVTVQSTTPFSEDNDFDTDSPLIEKSKFESKSSIDDNNENLTDVNSAETIQQISVESISNDEISDAVTNEKIPVSSQLPIISQSIDSAADLKIKENVEETSKEETGANEVPKNAVKRCFKTILDSDSEDEDFTSILLNKSHIDGEPTGVFEMPQKSETQKSLSCKLKSSRRLIDSDSDEDVAADVEKNFSSDNKSDDDESDSADIAVKKSFKTKIRSLTDSSDEDNENSTDSHNSKSKKKQKNDVRGKIKNRKLKKDKKPNILTDSESEEENSQKIAEKITENKEESPDLKKNGKSTQKTDFSNFIDSDTEDDELCNKITISSTQEENKSGSSIKEKEKPGKKRTGSLRASKDEAMRQIRSETQRLIRNNELSLPYHMPKQHSLQDFLNRKKLTPVLPGGLITAAKVRMSSEIVSKVLKEKEKEAKLFYKSSDSEEETINSTPGNLKNTSESTIINVSENQMDIEETQKILKNDIQNAHNKKEIIKQGGVDLGVPRKLFIDDAVDLAEMVQSTDAEKNIVENNGDDENMISEGEEARKKNKETKQGLREVTVPRKLFGSDYDEGIGSQSINYDVSMLAADNSANSNFSESTEIHPETTDEVINSLTEKTTSDSAINDELSMSVDDNVDKNDFTLKFVDDSCDKTPQDLVESVDDAVNNENNISSRVCNEPSDISDTPFISNKEFAKFKEKDEIASGKIVATAETTKETLEREIIEEMENDTDNLQLADGHVFGLPPPDFDENESNVGKSGIKKKVLSAVGNVDPKLRGIPGMMIDFTEDVRPNAKGVENLVDRFMRHSGVNKSAKDSPGSVTVLHAEQTEDGVKLVEEILPYTLPTINEADDKTLSKPGAKFLRLKHELIKQMVAKRGEEWNLKQQQQQQQQEKEKNDDDIEEHVELNEEFEEFECSTESEPEEDDMPRLKKKKKKRKPREFADEEAEVSEEEGLLKMTEEDEEEEESEEEEEEETNVVNEDEDEKEEEEEKEETKIVNEDEDTHDISSDEEDKSPKTNKSLNRIVKAFEDDSNSLPETPTQIDKTSDAKKLFERTKTDVDMFEPEDENDGWLSDTEAELPPSQVFPRDRIDLRSPLCETPLTAANALRFVSPITQLTALNSCTDSPKDCSASKIDSCLNERCLLPSAEKTPITKSPNFGDSAKRAGFQKKLFEEPSGTVNDEELMDLCSGRFTGIENNGLQLETPEKVSESQLINLCSGTFSSQALEKNASQTIDENSQDIRLTLDDDSCQNTFDKKVAPESKAAPWNALKVVSSSEEDSDEPKIEAAKKKVLKKKKVKKLELSDDEEDDAEFSDEEEEDDLEIEENDKYVDYDSEENEVVIVPKKDIKKVAADFLEAEAELSESEWGSADEDEKDMDKLDLEMCDDEEIDENQMRDQLGQLHMLQVMNDDQRDVNMIKELLFDDGDLYTDGSGRQRTFKWKNINELGEESILGPRNNIEEDDKTELIEEDNDVEWRKHRIERDNFIAENEKVANAEKNENLVKGSQLFELGMKALKKKKNGEPSQIEPEQQVGKKAVVPITVLDLLENSTNSPKPRIPINAAKRGSFLARGDDCLARLAVTIKQSITTVITQKNPRNCVFTRVTPEEESPSEREEGNSMKTTERNGFSNQKTRKRKPPAGITSNATKKAKIEVTRTTGKKQL